MAVSKSNPFSTDTVVGAIAEASRFVAARQAQYFSEYAHGMGQFRSMESPIEAVFWVWWEAFKSLDPRMSNDLYRFDLSPQYEVIASSGERFRLDFAIADFKIAVELDGHEFHERTKEQVAYRNTRDRKLQADGWTVLHISGSELWRAPMERVEEVYGLCRRQALAAMESSWRAIAEQSQNTV